MKVAGRIRRVLSGHSPVALVHAVTAEGHELKLEVPSAEVVGVGAGDLLVVDWYAFHLDDVVVEDAAPASPPETADSTAVETPETPPEEVTPVASVRRMLGLPT